MPARDRDQAAGSPEQQAQRGPTSPWERFAAGLGAVLIVVALGYLVYRGVSGAGGARPAITVAVDTVADQSGSYLVGFTVTNRGGATAAGLRVEGRLRSDSGVVERSETTLDYLPAHSHREAGLFFTHDPRRFRLELRPVGYQAP